MKRKILGALAVFVAVSVTTFSQSGDSLSMPTVVSAEEINAVVTTPPLGGDKEVKIVGMGRYNLGVAVLQRGASKPGGKLNGINHTKISEAYYVVSGEGTFITGTTADMTDIKPIAPDNPLVTTVVGPGNNATFVKPSFSQHVKTGDVVLIPPGVYHGFSEIPDHIEYVTVRTDPDKVLPAGYINPAIKK
jgi:mannose-6-phosphate isomerase-like protein (cupin superfamily)